MNSDFGFSNQAGAGRLRSRDEVQEFVRRIGVRIQKLREARKLTQEELAFACGLESQSTISRYETGERYPDAAVLTTMAGVLCVSLIDLVNVEEGPRGRLVDLSRDAGEDSLAQAGEILARRGLDSPEDVRADRKR